MLNHDTFWIVKIILSHLKKSRGCWRITCLKCARHLLLHKMNRSLIILSVIYALATAAPMMKHSSQLPKINTNQDPIDPDELDTTPFNIGNAPIGSHFQPQPHAPIVPQNVGAEDDNSLDNSWIPDLANVPFKNVDRLYAEAIRTKEPNLPFEKSGDNFRAKAGSYPAQYIDEDDMMDASNGFDDDEMSDIMESESGDVSEFNDDEFDAADAMKLLGKNVPSTKNKYTYYEDEPMLVGIEGSGANYPATGIRRSTSGISTEWARDEREAAAGMEMIQSQLDRQSQGPRRVPPLFV
jgi:hypothetical protein